MLIFITSAYLTWRELYTIDINMMLHIVFNFLKNCETYQYNIGRKDTRMPGVNWASLSENPISQVQQRHHTACGGLSVMLC